jgi:hypothetical protein
MALPPATPLTLQLAATVPPAEETALNCCIPFRATLAAEGETEIAGGGGGGGGVLDPPQEIISPAKREMKQVLIVVRIVESRFWSRSCPGGPERQLPRFFLRL